MDGAPTLLGEFGIPFDMANGKAYKTGDYGLQVRALSANYDAVDASQIDSTLWNYTASNSHESGDGWCGEDLSVFCRDDYDAGRTETGDLVDRGGRALRGFVRPYARAVAGDLVSMRFNQRRGLFSLRFRPNPRVTAPTEIFLPNAQYPRGYKVKVSRGSTRPGADGRSLEVLPLEPYSAGTVVTVKVFRR
jgi:hypothetical protein